MLKKLFLFLILFISSVNSQSQLLIKNANVIDVNSGSILENSYLLIQKERIKQISRTAIEAGPDCITVDAKGKYLIPGLWDMHTHHNWDKDYSELFVANGVLGTRNMFTPMSIISPLREKIKKGEKIGPLIIAAGRIVDGPKSSIPGSYIINSPEKASAYVDSVINDGSDFLKPYDKLSRAVFTALADECRKRNFVIAGHVPTSTSIIEASNAGLKSIEHLFGVVDAIAEQDTFKTLEGKSWLSKVVFNKDIPTIKINEERFNELVNTFKKNQTWVCPTLAVWNSISTLDDKKTTESGRLNYFPDELKEFWSEYSKPFLNSPKADWQLQREIFAKFKFITKRLFDSGVNMIAGTDCTNPYTYVGFSMHDELRLLAETGIDPLNVLRMATINAAKYLNLQKDYGSVEEGKIASLVLLDENPLEDISNTVKINMVLLNGRLLNRAELDKLLNTYHQ